MSFSRSSFNCWPFAWFRHCLRHSDQLEPLPSLRSICHKCDCRKHQGMLFAGTKTSPWAILQQQEENFGIGQYNGANFDSTRGTAQIQGKIYFFFEFNNNNNLKVKFLFCLGSPLAIFGIMRGVDYKTVIPRPDQVERIFNIFHPYDPVAYRIEPMFHENYKHIRPLKLFQWAFFLIY